MQYTKAQPIVLVVARVLLSAIFLMSGVGKIFDFSGATAYMEANGMPLAALFLVGAIVFEIVGGLFILLGYKAQIGALMLVIFLIPTTLIFHNFWGVAEEMQQAETIQFMKNLAIMGGLLMVLSFGPGSMSLEKKLTARK